MRFIIPLLITLFGTSMLSSIIKKKFEITLPIFLMSCALIVYLFSLIHVFMIGIYVIIGFSLCFPIYIIYNKFKNKKKIKDILKYVLTPGLLMYLLIYIFIFILNYNRVFGTWDEFSHWGVMVKETLRLKDFYLSSESILRVHPDYPPIVTIFETIWCILSGYYKESIVYTSLQLLGLSLIFPFLSKFKFKKNLKSAVLFVLCFLCLLIIPILVVPSEANFYSTIYIDSLLGLLIAYGLGIICINKKIDKFVVFNLMILFSFMLLTKQIAIVFVMLIVGYLLLNLLINKKINIHNIKKNYKFIIVSILLMIAVPFILSLIWSSLVEARGIIGQFNISDIKLTKLIGIYQGVAGELYQNTAMHNFIESILYNGKYLNLGFIQLTFVQAIFLACTLVYLLSKISKNIIDKNKLYSLIFIIIIGSIGYAFTMMCLYVFCFGAYEGVNLASVTRYINTYLLTVFALIAIIYLYVISVKENIKIRYLSLPLIIAFCFWFSGDVLKTFKPRLTTYPYQYQEDVDMIDSKTKDTDKIYVIAQNSNGSITGRIQYLSVPRKINLEYYSLGNKYYDGDIWTKNITPEEWFNKLEEYDYLYLYNVDDNFINKYGDYFKDDILNKNIYKIDKESNSLELIT